MNYFKQREFYVSEKKIKLYLLNTDHPDGGGKARFFINHGFRLSNWRNFAEVLKKQAKNHPIKSSEQTLYGTKYIIDGVIETPAGTEALIRTVWIIKTNNQKLELVTAYPI